MCFFVFQDHLIVVLLRIDLIAEKDPVEKSEASFDIPDSADGQTVKFLTPALSLEPDQVDDAAEEFHSRK